jgi:hypothetical protein
VVSATVTWKLAEPLLLLESDAEQVTVRVPSPKVEPEAGTHDTLALGPSTRSRATGVAKLTFDPLGPFASTVTSAGTFEKEGAFVSTTLMTNVAAAEVLLEASLAEHATVVLPSGNV